MVYIKQVEKPSDSSKIEVMESQKLPFEITPTIKRYLEDIVYLREEWLADKDILYMIEEEIPREASTPKRWGNNKNFWEYLEKQKAVKDLYGFGIESLTKIIGKNHPIQQIAIARTHGNEKSPVEKFWAQSKTWKKDLEKIAKLSIECSQGDIFVKPYILLKIFDFKPIEELLERIKSDEEKIQKIDGAIQVENYRPSKVDFDGPTAVLRYKTLSHKFQKGIRGDPPKLKLFRQLWDNKLHIRKGKRIAAGSVLDHVALAVDLGIAQERHSYELNKELRNDFDQLVKDIKRPLKKKGFPLEIERKNGVQLVIIEK